MCMCIPDCSRAHYFLQVMMKIVGGNNPLVFCTCPLQMQFLLLFSRQGKLRLQKWFMPLTDREKKKVTRDMIMLVLGRPPRSCNFLQWRDMKIVYRRWNVVLSHSACERKPEAVNASVCHIEIAQPQQQVNTTLR